jgi:hypothetical protein
MHLVLSTASHVLPLMSNPAPSDAHLLWGRWASQTLLAGVRGAKRRIVLGSLYIGTEGGPEGELVDALAAAVQARPELQVRASHTHPFMFILPPRPNTPRACTMQRSLQSGVGLYNPRLFASCKGSCRLERTRSRRRWAPPTSPI